MSAPTRTDENTDSMLTGADGSPAPAGILALSPPPSTQPAAEQHRAVLRAIEAARRSQAELERRSLGLKTSIRRDEQTVALWRRQIQETENHLARWRLVLAETESRLERSRQELALLKSDGGPIGTWGAPTWPVR